MSTTDPEAVKRHIQKVVRPIDGTKRVFEGVAALIQAAETGLLRRGQIIFGTVSAAHCEGLDDTQTGSVLNYITPVLTGALTGQARSYLFFHVAVYAGQVKVKDTLGQVRDKHYVIENGGVMG